MRTLCTTLIIVMATLVGPALADPQYMLTDLGVLDGYGNTFAFGLSESGMVVGCATNLGVSSTAVLFDAAGQGRNTDLGGLGGTSMNIDEYSINASGTIVGTAYLPDGNTRATLFSIDGQSPHIDLGTVGEDWSSSACAINDHGLIVGESESSRQSQGQAAVFDSTGLGMNMTLGTLPGYRYSRANDVNNSGLIVGYSIDGPTSDHRATLFDAAGQGANVDLGALPGGANSRALGVNDLGMVVGSADIANGEHRATLFDVNDPGQNVSLGIIPEYADSTAYDVNNNGFAVGVSTRETYGDSSVEELVNENHATLYDLSSPGLAYDLNDLVDTELGWVLQWASAINDRGQIIGHGVKRGIVGHRAFLLTPIPEPSSTALLLAGGLIVPARRKRTHRES